MHQAVRSLAVLLVAATVATGARAQQQTLVPVWIRDEQPGIAHRLTRDGAVVATCVGDCTMQVPIGTYVFESDETEEYRRGKKKVVISGPTTIDVSPGSRSTHTTGLVTGIVGSVAIVGGTIGLVLTAAADTCRSRHDTCSAGSPNYAPWLLTIVAGAALATAGWITFGTSGTRVRATPYASAVSFGAAPLPGGGFFGATLAF